MLARLSGRCEPGATRLVWRLTKTLKDVDASVAVAWLLPEDRSEIAEAIFADLAADSPVPTLFWLEMRNVLLVADRRRRIAQGEALLALGRLRRMLLEDAGNGRDADIMTFAARHRLTAYDATFLALASDRALSLSTFDRNLARAARAEGVAVVGPLGEA